MAFVRIPGNPEPEGAEELWLEGRGGAKLRAMIAPAIGAAPRGTVLLLNGRTEFIEKYFEAAREFQARGFFVMALDWRGQGLSSRALPDPMKGHFDTFDDPAQDLADAIGQLSARLPRPHIAVAHSMGGAITLRALQTRRTSVDGAVFIAPMWGIASLTPFAKRLARLLSSFGFGSAFSPAVERKWRKEAFKKNPVTHDKDRHARAQALVAADPRLGIAGPTLGWVTAAVETMEGFQRQAALAHLRFPVVILSASEEELVDNEAHAAVAKLLPNARQVTVEGAKHEILMETDPLRAQFWSEFDALAGIVAPERRSATA